MQLKVNSYGKTVCPKNWSWDTEEVPWYDYDLWVVLNGSGTLTSDTKSYNVSRGDCFCLQGGQHYIGQHNPLDPLTVIHIHFDYIDNFKPIRPSRNAPTFHRRIIDMTLLEGMLHKFLLAGDPLYSSNSTMENWLSCILDVITDNDIVHKHMQRPSSKPLSLYIIEHLKEQPNIHHRIKDLALLFGYSSDHLSRIFKADTGISLEKYIIESRINQATLLLINSNMSINEIAMSLGYKDIYHFSKQFKAINSCAPSKYRHLITAEHKPKNK